MNSLRPQFAETLTKLGHKDPTIFVVVGDISHGLLSDFRSKFPDRYRNIGICEQAMLGVAAGLNVTGFNPVVHTITPFLIERAFEQIKLDFGYQELNCNLVSVGSSFDYSKLGCSHHSYIDSALIASIEGSKVFLPGSKEELDVLFKENYNLPGIKYFRLTENSHSAPGLTLGMGTGQNAVLRRGSSLTIVALGPSLTTALDVSDRLLELGVSAEVLYVNTFKPFDFSSVRDSVAETRRLVTLSEISPIGGLRDLCFQAISGEFQFEAIDFSVGNFVRGYGDYNDLLTVANIAPAQVYEKILRTFSLS